MIFISVSKNMTLPTHTWDSQAPKLMSPCILGRVTCTQGPIAIEPLLSLLAFVSLVFVHIGVWMGFVYASGVTGIELSPWNLGWLPIVNLVWHCCTLSSPCSFWVVAVKLGFLLGLQWEKWHTQCAVALLLLSHYWISGFLLLDHPCCDFGETNTSFSVYQFQCCLSCSWLSVPIIFWNLDLTFL